MSITDQSAAPVGTAPVDQPSPHPGGSDIEGWLTERVAFHLRRTPGEIDPDTPLADYGIDSVAAISICGEIEAHVRLAVSPTIAYDFPTVHAISEHLAERLACGDPS
ncbi:polyketide synthase [Streptomyces sp. uw30]|uniref:acyl carrier protein n=1 Tax=Streptomyces sp. uw30 TaxID=1828179 RepID=UPI0011CD432C|nr:acyl carrier protein [Streptomyces sp. uw30]TXS48357.1 polyketide synthase [Streptomyces sp. uw30]